MIFELISRLDFEVVGPILAKSTNQLDNGLHLRILEPLQLPVYVAADLI